MWYSTRSTFPLVIEPISTLKLSGEYTALCWGIQLCAGVYSSVLGYTALCWGIQLCAGVYSSVLGYTALCWGIQHCAGVYSSVLEYTALCWSIQLCAGVYSATEAIKHTINLYPHRYLFLLIGEEKKQLTIKTVLTKRVSKNVPHPLSLIRYIFYGNYF